MTASESVERSVRLHRESTTLASKARLALITDDESSYLEYTRKAFEKESQSAELLRHEPSHHMHAILHRSAATLAYRCGENRAAETLIAQGLAGDPKDSLREQLYELQDRVRLKIKLNIRDLPLEDEELVMTLLGTGANKGLIEPRSLARRITNFETLIRNTLGSVNGHSFRNRRKVDTDFRVLATPPKSGSYRIGMTIVNVGPQRFPSLSYFDGVRSRLLKNLSLLNGGDLESLRKSLHDETYLHNLVGLAKELAPDGELISAVSIEGDIEGRRESISFDRSRDDLNEVELPSDAETVDTGFTLTQERESVVGVLDYASAKDAGGEVKLLANDNKRWTIVVSQAIAEDVVKPYFGDRVRVDGRHMIKKRKAKRLYLDDIRAVGERSTRV